MLSIVVLPLQAWKIILRTFGLCPGFIVQHFKSDSVPIDTSSGTIVLAQLEGISVFNGDIMIHSEPSDTAFLLKVCGTHTVQ